MWPSIRANEHFGLSSHQRALLSRGEELLKDGNVFSAIKVYSEIFSHGVSDKALLGRLVSDLLRVQSETCHNDKMAVRCCSNDGNANVERSRFFECGLCGDFYVDPVTILCGHTYCLACIKDEFTGKNCKKCGFKITEESNSVNILLCNIISKWFPSCSELGSLKSRAWKLVLEQRYEEGIAELSEILRNFPQDLNSRCWRSDCFLKLGYPEIALRDIEIASAARPDLLRVLHRKARVLSRLTEDTEQVIILLLRCCALEPENKILLSELEEAIHRLFKIDVALITGTGDVCTSPSNLNKSGTDGNIAASQETKRPLSSVKFESPVNEYEEMAVDFTRESYSSEKSCLSPSSPEQEMSELNGTQSPKVDNGATKDCNDLFSENLENGDIRSPASNTEQLDDFECKLCFNLLLEPVTSSCGHSFCRDCLYRSLDHRVECPCCRAPLTKILAERRQAVTSVLDGMIKDFFPVQYEKRKNLYAAEMEELRRGIDGSGTIPIFICTLAFPTVQCPLHIFEPRYRLMIRRCVESGSGQFGMCAAGDDPSKPFATFGTMLKIKDVQYLQDGRSIINTIGTRRFSVQSYNMKDGYYVAKVKWVKDDVEEDVEEKAEIQKATLTGFAMLQLWFNSLNEEQQKCITDAIGLMPNCDPNMHVQQDGPEWVWWSLAALPLQDKPKLIILAMTSTIERLRSIQRFLMLMIQMQKRANPPKVST